MVIATGHRITSIEQLREQVGVPRQRSLDKQLSKLDKHCRAFIERSPFMLLGTSSADGRCDVSPKGDAPGFVRVLDDHTLAIPDRPGNKRFDSLQNMLANPHVGLLFVVPGIDETLRVNGTVELVQDPRLLASLAVEGKAPLLAILVHVEEAYIHCARSFLRGHIWDPAGFVAKSEWPTISRVIADQTRPADRSDAEHESLIAENDATTRESYRCLY
jgi:uncharacterized protein